MIMIMIVVSSSSVDNNFFLGRSECEKLFEVRLCKGIQSGNNVLVLMYVVL